MLEICRIESGGNPAISNWHDSHETCNGSFGLLQIGCIHGISREELYNPYTNIKIGHKIYEEQGYGAWINSYKKVLVSRL